MHGAFGQRLPWEATLSSLMFGDYNTHSFWSLTSLHVSMGFLGLWRYNTYMVLGWNHQDLDVLKMLVGKKTNILLPNGGEKWWRNHLPNGRFNCDFWLLAEGKKITFNKAKDTGDLLPKVRQVFFPKSWPSTMRFFSWKNVTCSLTILSRRKGLLK